LWDAAPARTVPFFKPLGYFEDPVKRLVRDATAKSANFSS
jgi:hypothetical protein